MRTMRESEGWTLEVWPEGGEEVEPGDAWEHLQDVESPDVAARIIRSGNLPAGRYRIVSADGEVLGWEEGGWE